MSLILMLQPLLSIPLLFILPPPLSWLTAALLPLRLALAAL